MTQDQIITNNTAKAVIGHFDKNEPLWKGKGPLETSINNLKAYHGGVEAASYLQVYKITKGLTADKKGYRNLMVNIALGVITKVRPYAIRTDNKDLLQAVDYSETELTHCKEEICTKRCMTIAAKSRENLLALATHSLTENDLVALETAIEPFLETSEKRDISNGEREAATNKIATLIPFMRKELKILDDLVESQITDQDFKATYNQLR